MDSVNNSATKKDSVIEVFSYFISHNQQQEENKNTGINLSINFSSFINEKAGSYNVDYKLGGVLGKIENALNNSKVLVPLPKLEKLPTERPRLLEL